MRRLDVGSTSVTTDAIENRVKNFFATYALDSGRPSCATDTALRVALSCVC
jgi:hypothetical protein